MRRDGAASRRPSRSLRDFVMARTTIQWAPNAAPQPAMLPAGQNSPWPVAAQIATSSPLTPA